LASRLIEKSGMTGGKVFFTLAGADANENAVKFARWVTGKSKIITRYRSYHGATHMTLDLGGDNRAWHTQTGFDGIVHALPPYCYRCPLGLKYPACDIRCADHIADTIEFVGKDTVAAVMIEPHAGTNGIVAPPEYWPATPRDLQSLQYRAHRRRSDERLWPRGRVVRVAKVRPRQRARHDDVQGHYGAHVPCSRRTSVWPTTSTIIYWKAAHLRDPLSARPAWRRSRRMSKRIGSTLAELGAWLHACAR
jgi:hypothetical protein